MPIPIALQLYTVREEMAKDFDGTLKAVAAMGYKFVEFAGFYERTPQQIKAACDALGLKVCSSHLGVDSLRSDKDLNATIAAAKTIGYRHVVLSWVGEEYRGKEGFTKASKILAEAGKKAAAQGVTVCYHNHSFEFDKDAAGVRGIDVLFGDASPRDYQSELDVYWVTHGHDDPVAWMKKLAGRVPLLHIKDMDKTPERGFAEVGTGIIDFKPVVAAAQACGVQFYIIEQDAAWRGGALESAKTSLNNFKKVVGA